MKTINKINNLLLNLGATQDSIDSWWSEPKEEYFDLSPFDFIKLKPENAKIVMQNLQSQINGEAVGS